MCLRDETGWIVGSLRLKSRLQLFKKKIGHHCILTITTSKTFVNVRGKFKQFPYIFPFYSISFVLDETGGRRKAT